VSLDESAMQTTSEWHEIEKLLYPDVICTRCGATIIDYGLKCSAPPDQPCLGFFTIEGARQHLKLTKEPG
jgi:hypothetical protein